MAKDFRVIDNFATSASNDPKMTLNITRSKVPYVDVYQIRTGFTLQPAALEIVHLEITAPKRPPMEPWTLRDQRYPINVFLVPPSLKFQSITATHFWVTSHLAKRTPKDTKVSLDAAGSKVSHISATSTPQLQISLCFALRAAIYELQVTSKTSALDEPRMTLATTRSKELHYSTPTEWTRMTLNTTRSKELHYSTPRIPNLFHLVSLHSKPYSETWELGTPKGLPKTVLNSKVFFFLRFISMY